MENDNELLLCDNNVEEFSFNGLKVQAKIVYIYDGDTFKACFRWLDKIYKFNFRCANYDSPELKPLKKNFTNELLRIFERNKALKSKLMLENVIKPEERLVTLELGKFDKYGRILAKIYIPEMECSVNDYMIKNGYGKIYNGKNK